MLTVALKGDMFAVLLSPKHTIKKTYLFVVQGTPNFKCNNLLSIANLGKILEKLHSNSLTQNRRNIMEKTYKIGDRTFVLDESKAEAAFSAKMVING